MSALDGIRVLDFSTSLAGAWCSRLLADFGADVALVEPPGGHPLRKLAPFDEDGASIAANYVQANKRSVAIDIERDDGREVLADLAAAADVVVESTVPGTLAEWGLAFDALEARRPRIVLVSITPHGQDGRRARFPGNDLTAYALSGWASVNGLADREPLKGSGFNASYVAGTAAYGATLTALCHRELHGVGQQIDLAEVEALGEIFGRSMLRAQYEDAIPRRNAEMTLVGSFPVPVKDGHISLGLGGGYRFRDALNVLGLAELADDEQMQNPSYRAGHQERFVPQIMEALTEREKLDLFDGFSAVRVGSGPVLTMEELASDRHLRDRGFYVQPEDNTDGPQFPGAPFKLSETPWALHHSAPAVGEHTAAVLADFAAYGSEQLAALATREVIAGVRS